MTEAGWVAELLNWFDKNRRQLPWREDKDPYKVWVSEIMLQQTKVEAVRPYFESWLDRFPTMALLAEASEDEVLHQWQGLGYYSRAKHLHNAVQEVVSDYGGKVPVERKEILSLPGIGDYTAGAVLSIAYGKPEVAVDGNVLRVFSRLYAVRDNVLLSITKKKITALAKAVLPLDRPGDFNEALMDFGAMVCIPRQPRCSSCPIQTFCKAYSTETAELLPIRTKRGPVPLDEMVVAVVEQSGRFLLHRRLNKGILSSMWEFPNLILKDDLAGLAAIVDLLAKKGVQFVPDERSLGEITHVFSHRKWHMIIYSGRVSEVMNCADPAWQWFNRKEWLDIPWAGPHGKITSMV